MKELDDYLTANGLSDAAFGRVIGVHQSTVWRLRRRAFTPTFKLAARIEKETGGAVPLASWAQPDTAA